MHNLDSQFHFWSNNCTNNLKVIELLYLPFFWQYKFYIERFLGIKILQTCLKLDKREELDALNKRD